MEVRIINVIKIGLLMILLCVSVLICTEQVSAASDTESESNNYIGSADVVRITGSDKC